MESVDELPNGVGFYSFRISAVVRTSSGRILAFVEGRRHTNGDFGDIKLVYKKTKTATDHGANPSDWGSLREVDLTKDLMRSGQVMASGSTPGISWCPRWGRNIVGRATPGNQSWSVQRLSGAGAEGTICQTPDGKLYRNDRPSHAGHRIVAHSRLADAFGEFATDEGLPDSACQGSVLLYNTDSPARTIFMNSASVGSRWTMRVCISYDANAAKLNRGRELSDAPVNGIGNEGGYSSLTKTADNKIGALVVTDFFQRRYRAGDPIKLLLGDG
ncbi:hypothetical protein BBP40_012437 [Aspergillus hancockii]|nr:hypothetical protein BBP40_012437 [Aspergillus hancockii]